jgi:hypothetical protein
LKTEFSHALDPKLPSAGDGRPPGETLLQGGAEHELWLPYFFQAVVLVLCVVQGDTMKASALTFIFAATSLCTACAPPDEGAATDPSKLPHRKAGLWHQELSVDGRPQPARDYCFAEEPIGARAGPDETCDIPLMSRLNDGGLKIIDNCKAKDGRSRRKTVAVVRGDPSTKYTIDATNYFSSSWEPLHPLGGGAHFAFTYLGPCDSPRPG